MLARTPIGNRFYNWVAEQDPEGKYNWSDNGNCACGRFMQDELGLSQEEARCSYHATMFPILHDRSVSPDAETVWREFNTIAQGADYQDWTFGKLRERIAERKPECVL